MRKYNGRDQGIRAGERDGYEGRVMMRDMIVVMWLGRVKNMREMRTRE